MTTPTTADALRDAYLAALATASAAYRAVFDPASARMNKAMIKARSGGKPVPRAEVTAYLASCADARQASEGILAGPRDALDQALREARTTIT